MTMSIAARCAETGMLGVAISSSSIAVASRCANVRAGVGATLSQNVTDPNLGHLALDLMAIGKSAQEVVQEFLRDQPYIEWRQLVLLPASGAPAVFSGDRTLGVHAESIGVNCAAAGNLLAAPSVPQEMTRAFEESRGGLADRLLQSLRAGLNAGGEAGPLHSAGVLVAGKLSWPIVDLRVDWSDDPIGQLCSLWERYQPQLDAYVLRARLPAGAPAYGVAGDP
ncbi:MAG TPA: DUF1028 domain-containing protein [Bryobacteraceae bacterium]|nr:DUF1028 domain-containing protein [Bryobacteraceae bacterium]